jgi:hypothetical protein
VVGLIGEKPPFGPCGARISDQDLKRARERPRFELKEELSDRVPADGLVSVQEDRYEERRRSPAGKSHERRLLREISWKMV